MSADSMTSSRPYLVRAVYEWLADNGLTPQLVVDAGVDGVHVPQDYVQDGRIVLNVSARAVRALRMTNEAVEFHARFGGMPFDVYVPAPAVLAIVARENGAGMSFPEEATGTPPDPDPDPPGGDRPRGHLKVVK